VEFAVSRGIHRTTLLERSGIHAADLTEPDNRISVANYVALLEAGVELCNEPALALLFGESVKMQDVSIVGMIGETSKSVEEARRHVNRYASLLLDSDDGASTDRIQLIREKGGTWFILTSPLYIEHRLLAEVAMAQSVRGTRELSPEGATYLKAIRFAHQEPAHRAEYDRIFAVPIFFGTGMNALLMDKAIMSVKLPGANPYFSDILSAHADSLLQSLESARSHRGRVEGVLISILHKGGPNINVVSRELGVSRYTLCRRLKAEGITYKKVLDELRLKLAIHYLTNERTSVNETAYLLGFSEPAAFSRAFRRWTGVRPSKASDQNC
jgi:AraC-like DNA-binding protein